MPQSGERALVLTSARGNRVALEQAGNTGTCRLGSCCVSVRSKSDEAQIVSRERNQKISNIREGNKICPAQARLRCDLPKCGLWGLSSSAVVSWRAS